MQRLGHQTMEGTSNSFARGIPPEQAEAGTGTSGSLPCPAVPSITSCKARTRQDVCLIVSLCWSFFM